MQEDLASVGVSIFRNLSSQVIILTSHWGHIPLRSQPPLGGRLCGHPPKPGFLSPSCGVSSACITRFHLGPGIHQTRAEFKTEAVRDLGIALACLSVTPCVTHTPFSLQFLAEPSQWLAIRSMVRPPSQCVKLSTQSVWIGVEWLCLAGVGWHGMAVLGRCGSAWNGPPLGVPLAPGS